MKVVFRVDASLDIGIGHVMRCLALAEGMRLFRQIDCYFICRKNPGNLIEFIASHGFVVYELPAEGCDFGLDLPGEIHGGWLGANQDVDARQTLSIILNLRADWVVIDHYAIDERWERAVKASNIKIAVLDDLANRKHVSDLLVDQTLGRCDGAYKDLTPDHSVLLCGSQYALLRPEFAALRSYSIARRIAPKLKNLFINMGGIDKDNVTEEVLHALEGSSLPPDCLITVVMGIDAPWFAHVKKKASKLPWRVKVLLGVSNMGEIMAGSDLAIGSAGSTSWERCCLGLPSILIVLADNQIHVARSLSEVGAVMVLGRLDIVEGLSNLISEFTQSSGRIKIMSDIALKVSDGNGVSRVISYIK